MKNLNQRAVSHTWISGLILISALTVQSQTLLPIPTDPTPAPAPVDCVWNGMTIRSGEFLTAYQNSTVAFGQSCVSEQRKCLDGTLDGSYNYASCSVGQPADCLFNNATVSSGTSVTAFTSSTVAYGSSCTSVAMVRTCTNGQLSGQGDYATCAVDAPKSCIFNGVTLANNESVVAYASSTTQFGSQCSPETRVCENGVLSGSNVYASCTVDQPASCLWNGKTIANGEIVKAYISASVSDGQVCVAQDRVCQNGQLSGQGDFESCTVTPTPTPTTLFWEFPKDCGCQSGQGYMNSMYSTDGCGTWNKVVSQKLPVDLDAIWSYMVKKYGVNKCKRPNVQYVTAWHKGYVKFDQAYIPKSPICRFVEVEKSKKGHHEHKDKDDNHHAKSNRRGPSDVGLFHSEPYSQRFHADQNNSHHDRDDDDDDDDDENEHHRGRCDGHKHHSKVEIKFVCEDVH